MRSLTCAALGLCLCLFSCHHSDSYGLKPGPVQEWARKQPSLTTAEEHDSEEFALLSNVLAFKLFAAADKPGENIMISPVSAAMTLAMLANGAKGETQTNILKALNDVGGLKPINNGAYAFMVRLESTANTPIALSNAAWMIGSNPPTPDRVFSSSLSKSFDAKVGNANSIDVINDWAKQTTDGMIDHVADTNSTANVAIENCAAFKAAWLCEFDPKQTEHGDFNVTDRHRVQTQFMRLDHRKFPYYEGNGVEFMMLPYKDQDFAMVLINTEQSTPEEFLKKQTWESWGTLLGSTYSLPMECTVRIPRWTSRYRLDLLSLLPKLGMSQELSKADFSGIAPNLKGDAIAGAAQSTFIDVNEHGTDSSAATYVSGDTGGGFFNGDHPFAYAVIHKPTGAILFLGVLNDPRK